MHAAASSYQHLYVAIRHSVSRYPLVNGHPAARPDLRIQGYGWPVATSPDGSLIATAHPSRVGVFAFGATQPTVVVHAPQPTVAGVAQDENGNLFVSNFVDGTQPYAWNVAVYDPTGKLVNDIALNGAGPIAVSPVGRLYAVAAIPSHWSVDVFDHPLTQTMPSRSFTSSNFGGTLSGIALAGAQVFVTDTFGTPSAPQPSQIFVFPGDAHGAVHATGAYVTRAPVTPLGGAAIFGDELFTGVQFNGRGGPVWSVFEYDDGFGKFAPDERYAAADFPEVAVGL